MVRLPSSALINEQPCYPNLFVLRDPNTNEIGQTEFIKKAINIAASEWSKVKNIYEKRANDYSFHEPYINFLF